MQLCIDLPPHCLLPGQPPLLVCRCQPTLGVGLPFKLGALWVPCILPWKPSTLPALRHVFLVLGCLSSTR